MSTFSILPQDELYKYLRQVDNAMFCSGITNALSSRSWHFLDDANVSNTNPDIKWMELNSHKGTDYPSYVFYKLDFVLWYFRDNVFIKEQLKKTRKEVWDNYRMTSKNSVEHISPQNCRETDMNLVWGEADETEEKTKKLNDFGNLVLLTSNMNSEYSNNIYTTKQSEFLAKADNKRLDSLKSALIFENPQWNWDLCKEHRDKMVAYYGEYFAENISNCGVPPIA